MVTRIAIIISALFCLALQVSAQVTSDSKDLQIAKRILQLRARQLDSIVTVISDMSTDRMSPSAKAVYDFVQANVGGGHVLAENGIPIAQRDSADFRPSDIIFSLSNTSTTTRITASIAPDSVTTTEIRDGTILASDLNQMGATTGQVLRWSGAEWVPNGLNMYDVVTASQTVGAQYNQIIIDTLGANIILNLPPCNSGNDGIRFEFTKSGPDAHGVDIEPAGSEKFNDNATTKTLYSQGTTLICTCRHAAGTGKWFFSNM